MKRVRLALAAAVVATLCAPPAGAQTKLTVGSAGTAGAALFAAKQEGFFEKRGLDVTILMIKLNPDMPPALVAGSLDVALMTTPTFFQAIDGGLDLVAFVGGTPTSQAREDQGVVARADVTIKSPQDFIGRKVGVPGIGAGMHVLFRYWLDQHGVDFNKVNFAEVSLPQMRDALNAKLIDAVVAVDPFMSQMTSSGAGTIAVSLSRDIPSGKPVVIYTATRAWVEAHPKEVAAFRASIIDGATFAKTNPDKTKEDVNLYAKLPPQIMKTIALTEQTPDLETDQLAWWFTLMKHQRMLTRDIDVGKLLVK